MFSQSNLIEKDRADEPEQQQTTIASPAVVSKQQVVFSSSSAINKDNTNTTNHIRSDKQSALKSTIQQRIPPITSANQDLIKRVSSLILIDWIY